MRISQIHNKNIHFMTNSIFLIPCAVVSLIYKLSRFMSTQLVIVAMKFSKDYHPHFSQKKVKPDNRTCLRKRLGSCRNCGGRAIIGAGPPRWEPGLPFLPPPSKGEGPPCSLIICIAISGGAGTNGPKGLQSYQTHILD